MEADRTRWDDRYLEQMRAPASLVPMMPEGLDAVLDVVPTSGRALDLACGLGSQAVWTAQRGMTVVALDVSPVAVQHARELARTHGVADRVSALTVDLDDLVEFDVLSDFTASDVQLGEFNLMICQRFREPRMYPKMLDLLIPGGVAAITVLSEVGLGATPGPHHASAGELSRAVAAPSSSGRLGELLLDREGDGLATVVVRRVS